jgi:alginate O-acetyltransferase complex protein AlgI
MLTMLLGGLWHGASWNFVIWGGIHGGCLAAERAVADDTRAVFVPRIVRVLATFVVVCIAWVFFRAATLSRALDYLASLVGLQHPGARDRIATGLIYERYYVLSIVIAAVLTWGFQQAWDFTRILTWPRAIACVAVFAIALAVMFTQSYNPFIYYIF